MHSLTLFPTSYVCEHALAHEPIVRRVQGVHHRHPGEWYVVWPDHEEEEYNTIGYYLTAHIDDSRRWEKRVTEDGYFTAYFSCEDEAAKACREVLIKASMEVEELETALSN